MSDTVNLNESTSSSRQRRAVELFNAHQDQICRRSDRMFAGLMTFQWLAGIAAAVWISPRTWSGTASQTHIHVWAAVFLGGAISILPVWLALRNPGAAITRHAVAIGQMLTSALLIHLTGGRIETHFHVFGSLAFLAFYRDWRVLASATAVVAADHFLRGTFWPQSVFGVLASSPWRWIEHAGWVVFEDIFLLYSVHQSLKESRVAADREAALEETNEGIERLVQQRTAELEQSHKQLIEASRQAGMAEVASSVLHNVGNVLNSVNISSETIAERLRLSRSEQVLKIADMISQHSRDLCDFITVDPKGKMIPGYLKQLGVQLTEQKKSMLEETTTLSKNVDHIKDIVAMHQSYAKISGVTETIKVTELVEDALRMNASALIRHDVHFYREYEDDLPEITVEKHKVLQILVNLIRNAKQACDESTANEKKLTVQVKNSKDRVRISLVDNGIGIPSENMPRLFSHGFTTRKDGHGFGLHSGWLTAHELGGVLTAASDGPGRGATFTLELPLCPEKKSAANN